MKFIALVVYIIVQVAFIPLTIVGLVLTAYKQVAVSKKLDVSATAISAIGYRWIMHMFGMRPDSESVKLYRVLPNGSPAGLWLLFFPLYLRYRIGGKFQGFPFVAEAGTEGVLDVPVTRTFQLDKLITRLKDGVQQFVVLGAGYDTRCYGFLKNTHLECFELDKPNTQKLKVDCLNKAGTDISPVTFVAIDFSTENWYDKLSRSGYDPQKKTIFLWEGVAVYLTEEDVRKTLADIKEHATSGSCILMDLYSDRVLSFRGSRSTNEQFLFGLDFTRDAVVALKTFVQDNHLNLGDYYFMGHKTTKGCLGVIAEVTV